MIADVREYYRRALRADSNQTFDGTPDAVRLFGNTVTVGECWEYQGSRHNVSGHGRIHYNGRIQRAHRVAWELVYSPINEHEDCVLHKCDNPPCVNPGHLFLGTQLDNIADRDSKGRQRNQHTGPMGPPAGLADALHLGGNGLVPAAAREAFRQLCQRGGWDMT